MEGILSKYNTGMNGLRADGVFSVAEKPRIYEKRMTTAQVGLSSFISNFDLLRRCLHRPNIGYGGKFNVSSS